MTSSSIVPAESIQIAGAQIEQNSGQASILEAQHAIASALPELVTRAMREPYFRESLLRDTRSTIESVLSTRTGTRVELPEFLQVVAVENTPETINLVVPVAHEGMRIEPDKTSPASAILIKASRDEALLSDLLANPGQTMARELAKSSAISLEVDPAINFVVHTPSIQEVILVIPEETPNRVPTPSSVNAELNVVATIDASGLADMKGIALVASSGFTHCGNECSGNVCQSPQYSFCKCK